MANIKKSSCLVLLSSYNGEKYIAEQISSILSQEKVEVRIIIRDDGSKDKTLEILNRIEDERIEVIAGDNLGCIQSFSWLVNYAYEKYSEYEIYAFADQDDYWLSDKLYQGSKALLDYSMSYPNLYFCNMSLVDSDLNFVRNMRNHDIDIRKGNAWLGGIAAGCTMVFNRKLVELYANHNPKYCYHDYWVFLIALYLGNIVYDNMPYIKYRQHEFNVLGAHAQLSTKAHIIQRINYWINNNSAKLQHSCAKDFLYKFRSILNDEDKKVIGTYINYHKSISSFLKFLKSDSFKSSEPEKACIKGRILFLIRALFGKY